MAYTAVQHNHGTGGACAYPSAVTSASLLILAISVNVDTDVVTSVADSLGQSWTRIAISPANGLGERAYLYYKYNTLSGACTVTASLSGGTASCVDVYEFAGGPTTDPLDISNGNAGASSPGVTLAGCAADDLLFGMIVSTSTATAGTGFTLGDASNTWNAEGTEYNLDSGVAGNQAVAWTGGGSWTACAASFKLTAGGATPGGAWAGGGTRRAPAKAGPYDRRGFLLSPYRQYSYAPSFTLNAYSFSADPGTYAVTGAAAGLLRAAALPALAGSYTLTGAAAKLLVGHAVNAGTATYAINGVSSTELRTLLLNAGTGAYVLSGFAATLQAPSPDHPLAVDPTTYAVTGASAAALRGLATTVTGAYAISGAPALFRIQRGVPDGPSSYNVNGLAATLIYSGSGPAARVPWQRMGLRIGL